jgi:hypothetical protein
VAAKYAFIDEWEVDAPQEAVFTALADAAPTRAGGNWAIARAIEGLEPYARTAGATRR